MLLTGIASTPTRDRQGHMLDPLGATFQKTIPLLFQHDQTQPIGTARLGTPTADGIPFTATIPYVAAPGQLKDRIDNVRQSIREGFYKAVSIGWLPLDKGIELAKDGLRILKSEILELSIVSIPSNADARILSVKKLDLDPTHAALRKATSPLPLAGAAASQQDLSMALPLSEQITALQAGRQPIVDRMNELMAPVLKKEADLTEAQQTEYDGLVTKLETQDAALRRFQALERGMAGGVLEPVTKSARFGVVTVEEPKLPPGIGFVRMVLCQARGRLESRAPWEIAKRDYPSHPSIEQFWQRKAGVTVGTTLGEGGSPDSGWGSALATQPITQVAEFLEFLRPRTIIGRIPNLSYTPFNSRIQSQTTGGSANWVGQAKPKPVTKFDYDAIVLPPAKVAAISVLADELVRFSTPAAEGRVRDSLAQVITSRLDQDFIDPAKTLDAGVSPASITNGVSAIPSSGSDFNAVTADVQALFDAFAAANIDPTNLVWIMPTTTAVALSLLRNEFGALIYGGPGGIGVGGGTFVGFPVVVSQYAANLGSPAGALVILINASDIFVADDGGVSVDVSNQATIEMSDNPESDTGTNVSMFQNNLIALRAERYMNWARGRLAAVQYLTGVTWGAPGSPA